MSKFAWVYAPVILLVCAAVAVGSPAQTLTTLHSFSGADGAQPYAPLLQAANGDLYGTTFMGGATGDGTVFEITTAGALTTLHSFNRFVLNDGIGPYAGLLQALDGNLYGTTSHGGTGRVGTVYKVTPSGAVTTFQSFEYQPDGANVYAGLVQGSNGGLYGTAPNGGGGAGTMFVLTPFRQLTGLYDFGVSGTSPLAGLAQASDGNFYGTTSGGGFYSCGTIFRATPGGDIVSLHTFSGTDGCGPYATMTVGSDGNLYGTASAGGAHNGFNAGVLYRFTPGGVYTVLHVFQVTDGAAPTGVVALGSDGNFYGTTQAGGANGKGTIFKATPDGAVTTLYSFCAQRGCADGSTPIAGVIQASDGMFYGTTYSGGADNMGEIFRFSAGH